MWRCSVVEAADRYRRYAFICLRSIVHIGITPWAWYRTIDLRKLPIAVIGCGLILLGEDYENKIPCVLARHDVRSLPIRLRHTFTTCRMLPFA